MRTNILAAVALAYFLMICPCCVSADYGSRGNSSATVGEGSKAGKEPNVAIEQSTVTDVANGLIAGPLSVNLYRLSV